MLNHVAYITHDTSATVAFYTHMLGMELVAAVMDDPIPSTGDPMIERLTSGRIQFRKAKLNPPRPAHQIHERREHWS